MLKRYKLDAGGRRIPTASIYLAGEHSIRNELIDRDAVKIIERLKHAGFDTFLVGGAVRDLLLGKVPKDFDIATAASPKQIRKLFWNSRIIGRRFKLAHIFFQDKIYEVSTFRSADQGELGEHNVYGTIEEDAVRRDFTINSFYYDPVESQLLDFTNAMHDIRRRRLRSIIPLTVTFIEDPVRMIRCVKYAVSTGFAIPWHLRQAVRRYSRELSRCSHSRMTEEVLKILQGGNSAGIIGLLIQLGLFPYMLPAIASAVGRSRRSHTWQEFMRSLGELDALVQSTSAGEGANAQVSLSTFTFVPADGSAIKSTLLAYLIDPFVSFPEVYENSHELFREIYRQVKEIIAPITPPNYDVEKTVTLLFTKERIKIPRSALKKTQGAAAAQKRRTRTAKPAQNRTRSAKSRKTKEQRTKSTHQLPAQSGGKESSASS
jgi:poly(A) polymerase